MSELPYRVDLLDDVLGSWSLYTDSLDCAREAVSEPTVLCGWVYRDCDDTLMLDKWRGSPVRVFYKDRAVRNVKEDE